MIDVGVITGGKFKEKRIITEKGVKLGSALQYDPEEIKNAWLDIIQDSPFFHSLLMKLSNKKEFSINQIVGEIYRLSDSQETDYTKTGARAIVQILIVSKCISETKKDIYRVNEGTLSEVFRKNEDAPPELLPFLGKFYKDHQEPSRCAFIMMRFGSSKFYDEIVKEIKSICAEYNIVALRADDKPYTDDLFPNVRTYMHACGLGIAIFDRVSTNEHNPNVSLEVGYMMALDKPVLLLKDSTMDQLPTDLIGRLYKSFDVQNLNASLKYVIDKWVREKNLT